MKILILTLIALSARLSFAAGVQVVQTSSDGARLQALPPLAFQAENHSSLPTITIDPAVGYQKLIGIGGAFTESAATVINRLPQKRRTEILNAYFSPGGSNYSLCRVPIGSCDFSLTSYSYDETPGDTSLAKFSIAHDKEALIPLIKAAKAVPGAKFELLASPWSPPGWMTTRNALVARNNHLKPEFYKTYAEYLAKYLKAYASEGLSISYMTIQNESWSDSGKWETTQFQPTETVDFVKALGPVFATNNIGSKILIYDHNKGLNNQGENQIKHYADRVFGDGDARKFIWGVAFHWYGETQTDPFTDMKVTHEAYPEQHLIHSEACAEGGPHPNDYAVGERYGHDIIGCLNNWTEGWIDWNLVLDTSGGPNHANNLCSAPILADTATGNLIYNPSYYYLAHISKYFRPGAVILKTMSSDQDLEATACRNPDGKTSLAVMNRTEKQINYKVKYGDQILKPTIPPHSITTFVF